MSAEYKPKSWKKWLKKPFGRRRVASPAPSATLSTESCAPSSPSAAAAKAAQPRTDARVPNDHQPPAASQALPPALPAEPAPKPPPTECTDPPTPTLSVSERLWNAAYDSLETDNAELVASYLKTLETVLGANPGITPDTDISAEFHDPTKRQMHMRRLVEEGRAKISRASKITNGVGDVADFVLSVKGIIDLAVQSVPQAALPWAGVCVGLQMLRNPAQAMKSNLAGLAHVISRMDWYCALTEHLLNKKNVATGKDIQAVLRQLERSIVELYKALLQYQMKSVCSYYHNQMLEFLRGMVNLDDWDVDLKLVTDAEATVQNDAAQFFQEQTKISLGKLVEHAEGMERRLGDIRQDIRDFISLQKDARRDDIESACRRDLRVVDPQHDMERIEKSKDELLDDAYKWILRTPEYTAFTSWDDSGSDRPPRRLLWIKGHAGTGKTMLMIGLIRQLSDQPVALSPALSFFFCQGTHTALNNATAVLRSLIWLLLLQQPCLISHLLQKYKESGADLFRDQNAFIALSEVFRNMLKDPRLSPVYLAVDALDECVQGRSDVIHLISTSLSVSQKVRWLLSSRPEVDLLAGLKEQSVNSFNPSNSLVELDTQRLEEPVNAYINHKLMELKYREGYDDRILAEVSHEVRQRAENTFLWVALVFKELSSVEGWDAVETVQSIPPGLTDLYGHMMARIDEGNKQNRQRCKNVLAATFLVHRPLSLSELIVVAGLPAKSNPRTIVDRCGSFLTIKDETVYLIHQSAKDYLGDNYATRLQPAGPAQGHSEIVRRSTDAMSSMLRRNIYDLDPGSEPENMAPPDPDPLAPIRYSCIFWADHLCSMNSDNSGFLGELTDDGKVFGFLEECFLRWLESLSLIGQLSSGLLSIRKILHAAQTTGARTGRRSRGMAHSVRAVAFSPDDKILASASDDQTIRLWDTATGTHRQTLEGHGSWVRAVAFSPDGKTLVSASYDDTIRLWDTATGAHRQTLKWHSRSVKVVAFSPDSKTLASASDDRTIRLWDTATSAYRQTLEGHSASVTVVEFSPDGKTLASASYDNTIRLWDTATGTHRQTLEGHSAWVSTVAISPDGNTLASASHDKKIRLWDTATGAHRQTLEGHGNSVSAVAFSPDGKCLETDRGLLSITGNSEASSSSGGQKPASGFLFVDDDWVIINGKRVLWLPADYRATCVAVHGHALILGHSSGRVTFFRVIDHGGDKCRGWFQVKVMSHSIWLTLLPKSPLYINDTIYLANPGGGTSPVKPEGSARFLGVWLDWKLNWKAHLVAVEKKLRTQSYALSRIVAKTWGMGLAKAREVYTKCIRSALAYGASSFHIPTDVGGEPVKKGITKALGKAQNKSLRIVAGAFKSTPIRNLETETWVPPLDLYLNKRLADFENRLQRPDLDDGRGGKKTAASVVLTACRKIQQRLSSRRGNRGRPRTLGPQGPTVVERAADTVMRWTGGTVDTNRVVE
ncbi:hypothetical protein CHGG_03034 [Chaetomium globosum CBS 148.51]|uniref:NACHT domain-containing protein n=1 Tax=Chaetomium globosum (strain ATCC 6205 / CBS 148.51 / DSM 1962 / NBRC 6347 / NRRL 1970) TaxID=306901 RepID=Q2H9S0_CHAGB|nr:uncharacterized protein CHGG_03034 [Chaetomium globosum CBS 148.51]EAQ91099.1 hypothetical protein CHGG_03034 [Chaetomium globosum CBS 148.51]